MKTEWAAFVGAICVAVPLPGLAANHPSLEVVSAADPLRRPSGSASGDSTGSSISPNGALVLFVSSANDLVPGDDNGLALDLFLRNRTNGVTTLISANAAGTGGGNGHSAYATFTPDGRSVVFESEANNLVTNDSNRVSDVFVRDVPQGKTTLVSVNAAGTTSGNGASSNPVLTPDGRYVAFVSAASDLVKDDTNGIPDVFVRDLLTGATTLVSVGAEAPANSGSQSDLPVISTNGQVIAFVSTATNLVMGATNWLGEVYVRDLVAGTTLWASSNVTAILDAATGGVSSGPPVSSAPVLSDDGRFLAFETCTGYQPAGATDRVLMYFLLRRDLQTGAVDLVATNATGHTMALPDVAGQVEMTPDGQSIAYTGPVTTNDTSDVWVWDAQTGTNTLVSMGVDGSSGADGLADTPAITPDGRYVVFVSDAMNLVTNAADGDFQVYLRDVQAGATKLVTADPADGAGGGAAGAVPTISDDGRFVAFDSFSDSFVAGDANNAYDVFVRDVVEDRTELVSSRDVSLAGLTGNGFSAVLPNCISADDRCVVFLSEASDLVANDTNGFRDVFVRDLVKGTNVLVSVATDGTQADRASSNPVISADGNSVVFVSSATNLAGRIANRVDNIYVRDLAAGTTTLVSVSANGINGAERAVSAPSISADGSRVAFESAATNLVGVEQSPSAHKIFVRDLKAGLTSWVSSNVPGASQSTYYYEPVVSPDGRFVVFQSSPGGLLVLKDLAEGTVTVVETNFYSPVISADSRVLAARRQTAIGTGNQLLLYGLIQGTTALESLPDAVSGTSSSVWPMSLSADGRFVAFTSRSPIVAPDTNNLPDVFLYDTASRRITLVSVSLNGSGGANGSSYAPTISGDGRFVVYSSEASDLVAGDINGWEDVFLYDRSSGRNTMISRSQVAAVLGNARSSAPVISADGQVVVFESVSDGLVAGDFNQTQDVFLCRIVAAPRVEVLGPSASGAITLQWDATPGQTYLVEYKGDLQESDWKTCPGAVTVGSAQASWVEPQTATAAQRIYRVNVVQSSWRL